MNYHSKIVLNLKEICPKKSLGQQFVLYTTDKNYVNIRHVIGKF